MHIIFFNKARETKYMMGWQIFQYDGQTVLHQNMVGTLFLQQIIAMLNNTN